MGQFSLANLFGLTIRESANDGSDFTNPDADYRRLFLGEDGALHLKDSAGAVTDIGGSGDVATDAIWDAKGDLAAGTGANTAAVLTVGTNGYLLSAASGEATGLKWVPAYRGAKAIRSSNQSLTNNSAAAVQFDAADDWDTDSWHDPASNNTRMTVPTGVTRVRVTGSVEFANNGTGDRAIYFQKNGGAPGTITERTYVKASANWITCLNLVAEYDCVATNYFELFAFQDCTGSLNLSFASFTIEAIG